MLDNELREKVVKGLECCDHDSWGDHEKCPYDRKDNDGICLKELIHDVHILLKAQEPHVMTLQEALGSVECWLERKDGSVTVANIALNGKDSGGYDVDSNELSTMRSYIFHSGYYGKYWRCWTSRPTDAQREAVKWE